MDLRIFTEPQQGATYDDLLAFAQRAEQRGFDAFFRSDHCLAMGADGLPGSTDAWLTLVALARETSTIRLGTRSSPACGARPSGIPSTSPARTSGWRAPPRSPSPCSHPGRP